MAQCAFKGSLVERACTEQAFVGLWCPRHQLFFARIREEMEADALKRRGGKGGKRSSTCCKVGCMKKRLPLDKFCKEHLAESLEDE